jgi:hypothetical protein
MADETDLASLGTVQADTGVAMPIIHPGSRQPMKNKDGSPMSIKLLSRWSDPFQECLRAIQLNRARFAERGETMGQDDLFDEDTATLLACTTEWTIKQLDGKEFPCSPQNIKRLWLDKRFRWLRERALNFILRDANFLAAGSEPLSDTLDISSGLAAPSLMAAQ